MIPVCTAEETRALDAGLITGIGVPGIALMDQASRGLAEVVRGRFGAQARAGVVVVCGPGNNGGDGYGAARWLKGWGIPVEVWPLSETSPGDAGLMRAACKAAGVGETDRLGHAGLIVDAVFGTGLTRPVTGAEAAVLRRIDTHPAPVVAADLPSGLHSDTGQVLGTSLSAAHTVTFGRLKRGLFTAPGADLAGEVSCVDIGLDAAGPGAARAALVEDADVLALWPRRASSDHKTRSGRVLVIAGSVPMAGAAVLACKGALAAGAGLVTLAATSAMLPRLAALPPEVMVVLVPGAEVAELSRLPDLTRFDALVVGPGLGGGAPLPPHTEMALSALWHDGALPMVFDADALSNALRRPAGPRIVTPHAGEAGRLLGRDAAAVQADRFGAVVALAGPNVVGLLKGRHTLVAAQGAPVRVIGAGDAVLATGGSGDVLSGVIGALLARGLSTFDAATGAAHVHGRAGELLAGRRGEGWTASDVAAAIPEAVGHLAG